MATPAKTVAPRRFPERFVIDDKLPIPGEVRLTFQIDRSPLSFQVPIILNIRDFDDTEMVEAARDALHSTFAELTAQTENWRLTAKDLQKLSNISLRPNPKKRPA